MGAPGASDEQLWAVLEQVNLAAFLKDEQVLDTPLSEKASNLSGGQCQRLALARALLHDSPVYIFDEATSNIDVESENDIMAGDPRAGQSAKRSSSSHTGWPMWYGRGSTSTCMDSGRVAESSDTRGTAAKRRRLRSGCGTRSRPWKTTERTVSRHEKAKRIFS